MDLCILVVGASLTDNQHEGVEPITISSDGISACDSDRVDLCILVIGASLTDNQHEGVEPNAISLVSHWRVRHSD